MPRTGDDTVTLNAVSSPGAATINVICGNAMTRSRFDAIHTLFAGVVNLDGGVGNDVLNGSASSPKNSWHLTALNAGDLNSSILFSSIENLRGGTGDDEFWLSSRAR